MVRAAGRVVVMVVAIVALTAAARGFGPGAKEASAQMGSWVSIVDFGFQPTELQVPAGTTVNWTNVGAAPHTVTSDAGAFGSEVLGTGGAFGVTFNTAGSYAYHCLLHPAMTGTVVVAAQ